MLPFSILALLPGTFHIGTFLSLPLSRALPHARSRAHTHARTHTHAHTHALSCSKLNQFAVKNTEQRMNKTVAKSQLSKNCMLPKVASHGEHIVPFVTGITFKTLEVQIIT